MSAPICDYWMWDEPVRNSIDRCPALRSGARVLDIGCGTGHLAEHLTERGCIAIGTDIASSPRWGDGAATYIRARSDALPFRDRAFHVVVSCSTLQYVDQTRVLCEVARVTQQGGFVLLHENLPHHPLASLYRIGRRLRAAIDPSWSIYVGSVRRHFSVRSPVPSTLVGETFEGYGLIAPLVWWVGRDRPVPRAVRRVDRWLLSRVPVLRGACAFGTYAFRVRVRHAGARVTATSEPSAASGWSSPSHARDSENST